MDEQPELAYWIALRRAGLGSISFARLLARFSTMRAAWAAPVEALVTAGLDARYAAAMDRARRTFDAREEMRLLEKHTTRAYTWLDPDYPRLLAEVSDCPPVLFVRGTIDPKAEQAVAVVGTRKISPYGRQVTELFTSTLARASVVIVSGLARGVDSVAHRVALENGAPTVAVLAGGVDQVYPRENAGLAARILENGCLVSEYPPETRSRADHFPRRNRIISGLTRATLVVEAGAGSGALHTANWAFEQGRDVFAIPGSVFSAQSAATNQLIRENTARLVATPEQLCEELNLIALGSQAPMPLPTSPEPEPAPLSATPQPVATTREGRILEWLADGPRHVDEVVRASGLAVAEVSSALQIMALRGLVREVGPMTYGRPSPAEL